MGNQGVIVVKKDPNASRHLTLENIPNLMVMMVTRSLASRGFLDQKYTWQYSYYFLNNAGMEHLRSVLHLPASVFPVTLTKQRTRAIGANVDEGGSRGGKGKGWGKGRREEEA